MRTSETASSTAFAVLAALLTGLCVPAQSPTSAVQTAFATHDKTTRTPLPGEQDLLPEVWVDVKTPGDGRTYSVGTIDVTTTELPSAQFSSEPADPPSYPPFFTNGFTVTPPAHRQIVVLQCCGYDEAPNGYRGPNDDQSILWQRYWYGNSFLQVGTGPWSRRATNARAVSVWAGATPAETRVAICGETYDMLLQKNQFNGTTGWTRIEHISSSASDNSLWGLPNGYIAVFNGLGTLLWSYQFYFSEEDGHCAITDVSIRVEDFKDVVTYCGISSFGVVSSDPAESLSPKNAYPAPPTTVAGYHPAAGNTDNRPQPGDPFSWDGIVGRLSNDHDNPNPVSTTRMFHAIVGGREQDGLWGLTELTPDRFVAVGGTATVSSQTTSSGYTFPLTPPNANPVPANWNLNLASAYCIGTASIFEVAENGVLTLAASSRFGEASASEYTHCRDVASQIDSEQQAVFDRIVIVGQTNDPDVFATPTYNIALPFAPHIPFAGPVDGFIASAMDYPAVSDLLFKNGSFQGAQGTSGYTGVATWSEFPDHSTAIGWASVAQAGDDLYVASYLADYDISTPLLEVRSDSVQAANHQLPTVLGTQHAHDAGTAPASRALEYEQGPTLSQVLASPAGGGISVDQRGRPTIVGATFGTGCPPATSYAPPLGPSPVQREYDRDTEAIRFGLDMLPYGVCRTDGTGLDTALPVPGPVVIAAGADGGTTPACMRLQYGPRVGEISALYVRRMLVDYVGAAPGGGANPYLVVDRPPPGTSVLGSFVCYGLPNNPMGLYANPTPMHDMELWVNPANWGYQLQYPNGAEKSWAFNLGTLPQGTGFRWTAQVITMLATPIPLDPTRCPGMTLATDFAASPALVFFY